ncbi:MAG: diaminopimelate decarboxylase [Thermomicrobiales bacterium]
MTSGNPLANLWPLTTARNGNDSLTIDGVDLGAIAEEVGTPFYVYDVATIRAAASQFRDSFARHYPKSRVVFAGKSLLVAALVRILLEERLGLDVVSGGELFAGLHAGMPASQMSFHGNNKSRRELREAIEAGVGKIVIDNDDEIDWLIGLAANRAASIDVMLRLNPGVDVHTHRKISTGVADSKFGLPISTGQAADAVARIAQAPELNLLGYHAHVGSQLFEPDAIVDSIHELIEFAARMYEEHGVEFTHLSPGGGFGIAYETKDAPLAIDDWMRIISNAVISGCKSHGLDLPTVTIEPGRALVGPAGVAVYEVGARKRLQDIRTYVSVDGGMADNIRPSLYEALYTADLVGSAAGRAREIVTIAGKYCESGDLLIEHIDLPGLVPGDLLAIPAAGAYCYAMSSNYNYAKRPPIVFIESGTATVVRRRETYEDLVRLDVT